MVKEILGNVESSEEPSDVLVRGLPRQPPGSNHRAVAHLLHLTAAQMHKKVHVEGRTFGFRGEKSIKLYLPSAGFKFLTDSLLVGKCVDWGRKKAGLN